MRKKLKEFQSVLEKAEQTARYAMEQTELAKSLSFKAEQDKRKAIEEARLAILEATEKQEEILERQRDVAENFLNFELIQEQIFEALKKEFQNDLERWRAELVREDLAIRFLAPEVLFEAGSSNLSKEFQGIIQEFIPRYVDAEEFPIKYR